MLSTNDYQERRQSNFAIHNLIIGAMSILLGIAFLASSQTVQADAVKPDSNSKLTTYSGLNSFFKSHDEVKTSKANKNDLAPESASNHTSAGKNSQVVAMAKDRPAHTVQTQAGQIHQGKWNNINVTYDDDTQELTLLGGTEDAPAIMQNGERLEPLFRFLPEVSGDRNTLKKITIQSKIKAKGSARSLFASLWDLTSIEGLTNLDTSEVTDMSYMFNDCEHLPSLNVTHFDTSKVTDMRNMFYGCKNLTSLDLTHFDTSQVTDMSFMFDGCGNLTSLDLTHFDTSEVTVMGSMFDGCGNLTSLDLTHFDTSEVTVMGSMFYGCKNLTSLDLTHFDTSQVIDMSFMFDGCENLTGLDLTHFDTSKVIGMNVMFADCENLTSLDVTHFDTSNVTGMDSMFEYCENLTSLNVTHFDTSKVTDMKLMFAFCENLTSLDVTHFDTSEVTVMGGMFADCENLTSLDVTHFGTSNVTGMDSMFEYCENLTSLNVTHFDTSKVTDMKLMFAFCKNLTSLDVTHFDTSKVTGMERMFYGCKNLTSLDLSRFDTSKVTDMSFMLASCQELKQLSLGKNFKFLQEQKTGLDVLPGKWINWGVANQQLPKGTKKWTSNEFTEKYNGPTDYDTYVRFENLGGPITVQYCDQNGSKISNIADEQQYGNVGDSLIDKTNPNSILSFKCKDIAGYNFDHAEINGQKVDLADIKYTDNPQTLTLFYVKANSDNNGGNNPNDNNGSDNSNSSNGANNTNGSNDSYGQNTPNNSSSIKMPVEFASSVTLRHNAYLYDSNGKRDNDVTFKSGSIVTVYGNKNINGRKFYILIDEGNKKQYYVAVGNVRPVSRKLKHNAYVYNKYGQRIKKAGIFKKAKQINSYGDPVTIRGHRYFIIDNGRFAKATNFVSISSAKIVITAGIKAGTKNERKVAAKTIMHNAYLYNNQGKRANKIIISAGSKINTLNLAKINNRLYYKLEDGLYIAAGNINATKRKLKHNAYIYSQYGNRIGKKVLKKRKFVKTYGYAVNIKHKKYYITAKNKFVKKANFR